MGFMLFCLTLMFSTAMSVYGAAKTDCGIPEIKPSVTQRIFGGSEATPNSWPWLVSLRHNGKHMCGGSVISPRWILTASHCFYEPDSYSTRMTFDPVKPVGLTIAAGQHHLDANAKESTLQVRVVKRFIVHERYIHLTKQNDVTVLELSEDLVFGSAVSPSCLPYENIDSSKGMPCYTAGWGATEDGAETSKVLLQVAVPVVKNNTCAKESWYGSNYKYPEMLCAGYQKGKLDSCSGDSGGPFMCRVDDVRWVQYGITSAGAQCGEAKKPGIYVRVPTYTAWIHDKTGVAPLDKELVHVVNTAPDTEENTENN